LEEIAEVIFQIGKWPCELMICLLEVLKCDFGDVQEALFQGVKKAMRKHFLPFGQKKGTWTKSLK
jgi:hypothetical protein